MVGERLHGVAPLAEPVEQDHGLAPRRRQPPLGLDRGQGVPALGGRALADDAVSGIEDAACLRARPPLQTPVVANLLVGPLQRLAGPPEGVEQGGVAAERGGVGRIIGPG